MLTNLICNSKTWHQRRKTTKTSKTSNRVSSLRYKKIKTLQWCISKTIIQSCTIIVFLQTLRSWAISWYKGSLNSIIKIRKTIFHWNCFPEISLRAFLLKMNMLYRNNSIKSNKNALEKLNRILICSKIRSNLSLKIVNKIFIINSWEWVRSLTNFKIFLKTIKVFLKTLHRTKWEMNRNQMNKMSIYK